MKCFLACVLVLCVTTRTTATPFCSDSSREFEERDSSCPSGRYYTSDKKFDIRHHCDGSSDNWHRPADSVDGMQCDYQETGWTECLPLELIGGADKADYIYNSLNPEKIYDNYTCGPFIHTKTPSETKVFLGVPDDGEEQSDCLIEIPDVYVAAEVYLNVGSEEKQNCCCLLRLDMYLIWAELASQGVPKSNSERNTTFHYFPVSIAYNHKIGRFYWPPNSSCTEKTVYSIDNGMDATLGLKAVLGPSSFNLSQVLAWAKEDLELIYWFRFGFTLVVAVNQYCYKGLDLICGDSNLVGCIQNSPQVVTTLAATQVFYTRTVSLDGANITALDPGYSYYQAVEECHLACLRQYATQERDLIPAGYNIDLDHFPWCKERVDVEHLGPLSPHWWNSKKCSYNPNCDMK